MIVVIWKNVTEKQIIISLEQLSDFFQQKKMTYDDVIWKFLDIDQLFRYDGADHSSKVFVDF